MLENIKSIHMEMDSIKYIQKQKASGEYEKQLEMDKQNIGKKMEILTIKSVRIVLTFSQKNYTI
jgi:hypothetical protein